MKKAGEPEFLGLRRVPIPILIINVHPLAPKSRSLGIQEATIPQLNIQVMEHGMDNRKSLPRLTSLLYMVARPLCIQCHLEEGHSQTELRPASWLKSWCAIQFQAPTMLEGSMNREASSAHQNFRRWLLITEPIGDRRNPHSHYGTSSQSRVSWPPSSNLHEHTWYILPVQI